MANEKNLKPIKKGDLTKDELKKRQRNGGKKSGEVRREKKLMSQLYAEFLDKDHDIIGKDGIKKKLSGHNLMNSVMSKVLSRGDSAAVCLMREIRQATEGDKIEHSGEVKNKIVVEIVDHEVKQSI